MQWTIDKDNYSYVEKIETGFKYIYITSYER